MKGIREERKEVEREKGENRKGEKKARKESSCRGRRKNGIRGRNQRGIVRDKKNKERKVKEQVPRGHIRCDYCIVTHRIIVSDIT